MQPYPGEGGEGEALSARAEAARMYRIEREGADMTAGARKTLRDEQARPVMTQAMRSVCGDCAPGVSPELDGRSELR